MEAFCAGSGLEVRDCGSGRGSWFCCIVSAREAMLEGRSLRRLGTDPGCWQPLREFEGLNNEVINQYQTNALACSSVA